MRKSKQRKIKIIEHYLYNFNNYKIAQKNLLNQLELLTSCSNDFLTDHVSQRPEKCIRSLVSRYEKTTFIVNTVESCLERLNNKEKEFIHYRYYKNLSVDRISRIIDCSQSSVFLLRRNTMDKLLFNLNNYKLENDS